MGEAVLHELTEKFDNYKVKSNKLTGEEKSNFIKDICNQETEDEMIQRLKIGVFTPDDMIKAGILGEATDEELEQFKTTGKIPMGMVAEAMSVITLVVKKLMTNKLLNQTKFTRSDGTIKNGFEIYRILQTPQAGGVNNIVYLTRQIQNLEKKEWTGNYEYLQTRQNDLKLTCDNIYSICTAISCIGGNEQATATNR